MRVLVVANHHRVVGGAETVAWLTAELLTGRGHAVVPFAGGCSDPPPHRS